MAGTYAHLTMVNLLRATRRLENDLKFSKPAAAALLGYLGYCELGAVSPDYPYLAIADGDAAKWADTMHWTHVGDMLKQGAGAVRAMAGEDQKKAFAWLLGYAAHVATDATIHPVVELKVGPYASNQRAHRVCEMHQDAYVWQRMNLGEIGLSEHLKSGIARCAQAGRMDPAVKATWESMLRTAHPGAFGRNPPRIDDWHAAFDRMVDTIAEEGNRLVPLARHLAVNCGLTYPLAAEIDGEYLQDLRVPAGATTRKMSYDQVFARAMGAVSGVWVAIEAAVYRDEPGALHAIRNWNLDTGRDEAGRLAFWN